MRANPPQFQDAQRELNSPVQVLRRFRSIEALQARRSLVQCACYYCGSTISPRVAAGSFPVMEQRWQQKRIDSRFALPLQRAGKLVQLRFYSRARGRTPIGLLTGLVARFLGAAASRWRGLGQTWGIPRTAEAGATKASGARGRGNVRLATAPPLAFGNQVTAHAFSDESEIHDLLRSGVPFPRNARRTPGRDGTSQKDEHAGRFHRSGLPHAARSRREGQVVDPAPSHAAGGKLYLSEDHSDPFVTAPLTSSFRHLPSAP